MGSLFAHPWGLVALAALPAILALHLFWRRFRPRRVSGLFLWAPEAKQFLGGRTRERLRRTTSLLLELLAALVLALTAASPSIVTATRKRHLVLVLDGSASMRAVGSDGRAFAEIAALEARSGLAGLWADDVATVIVSGLVAEIAAGPRAAPEAAREAIGAYLGAPGAPGEPGAPAASADGLDRATALARELALPDGRVVVITDTPRPPDSVPADVEFVSVGEARPNVGFVVADRTTRPPAGPGAGGEERVFVGVRNFSERPADCAVAFRLEGGGDIRRELHLAAGGTVPVSLALAGPAEAGPVTVEIEADPGTDALALDDRVTLVPPRRAHVAVANMLEGAARLALRRALASVPGTSVAEPDAAALVFSSSGRQTGAAAGAWHVVLTCGRVEKPLRFAGPYCLARDDPLLEDLSLEGVLWTATGLVPPEGLRRAQSSRALPLVSCGDHVLGWAVGSEARRRIVLDLDLARSNIARTAAWPVLVSNIVGERRRALPGLEKTNLALGETARLTLAKPGSEPVLVTAGGKQRLPGAGLKRHFFAGTLGAGEVLVRASGHEGDRPSYGFHVNFLAPEESDLSALGTMRVAARRAAAAGALPAEKEERARWPAAVLAAVALAAAAGDWYVLRLPARGRESVSGSGP